MSGSSLSGIIFFAGFTLQGDSPYPFLQGVTLPSSINSFFLQGSTLHGHQQPQPLLVLKKGLRTFSQTLFQSLEKGLTAPPVALTLRYPRPIKGSGCFLYRLRWTLVDFALVDFALVDYMLVDYMLVDLAAVAA